MSEDDMGNGRVTTKEFYDKLIQTEQRLITRLDKIDGNVQRNSLLLAGMCKDTEDHEKRLDSHATKIDLLQASDKRWGGINAALVAIGSTIAAIVGSRN